MNMIEETEYTFEDGELLLKGGPSLLFHTATVREEREVVGSNFHPNRHTVAKSWSAEVRFCHPIPEALFFDEEQPRLVPRKRDAALIQDDGSMVMFLEDVMSPKSTLYPKAQFIANDGEATAHDPDGVIEQ